jgi:hypothetical protein
MLRARHYDKSILGERPSLQGREIGDVSRDSKIGSVVCQRQSDLDARALFEIDGQVGIGHKETAKRIREECGHRGRIGQDPDPPFQTGGIRPQFAAHLLHLEQYEARMGSEPGSDHHKA